MSKVKKDRVVVQDLIDELLGRNQQGARPRSESQLTRVSVSEKTSVLKTPQAKAGSAKPKPPDMPSAKTFIHDVATDDSQSGRIQLGHESETENPGNNGQPALNGISEISLSGIDLDEIEISGLELTSPQPKGPQLTHMGSSEQGPHAGEIRHEVDSDEEIHSFGEEEDKDEAQLSYARAEEKTSVQAHVQVLDSASAKNIKPPETDVESGHGVSHDESNDKTTVLPLNAEAKKISPEGSAPVATSKHLPKPSESTERVRPKALPAAVDSETSTQVRYGEVNPPGPRVLAAIGSSAMTSAEASLKQSDSLRIAQSRIIELEGELDKIRRENEKLAAAGETIRRRADELVSKAESLEMSAREQAKIFEEERKVMRGQVHGKEKELGEARQKLDELETRLENNFKKIRVRERDLEHRLEIMKMESTTLISTKDKMILELKRQLDQLGGEAEHNKTKSQEMYNQFREKQETIQRVVRALRIALMILEGEDENQSHLKKVD